MLLILHESQEFQELAEPGGTLADVRKNLSIDDLGDLFDLPLLAVLATFRRDGSVLLSPVWHEWRDGGFTVASRSSDGKVKHLRRNPQANIVVCEHTPPYRGIELRCDVRLITTDVDEATLRISSRYLGAEGGAAYVAEGGDDVLLRLEPGVLRTWDFADDDLA
jgi:PPOX class probable F420-dependent enzyme